MPASVVDVPTWSGPMRRYRPDSPAGSDPDTERLAMLVSSLIGASFAGTGQWSARRCMASAST